MEPSTKKILVADDEPPVVQIIRANLELEGYQVVTAYDGVQALEKAKAEQPDLLILDIMMPRMDGFDVLDALKEDARTENLPVIMLTALNEIDHMDRAARKGSYCYLTKPFEPMELLMIVRRLLTALEEEQLTV
ncbi:MAG: response regulator [Abditibacteriales bacterium]|nr:response regulator [Abditibacteriales bacterium]MDW8365044.1 response regulator [Abditibacteriales bacterium]